MLSDPTKKMIQYDAIPNKIDLSKTIVVDNSPILTHFPSGVIINKIKQYTG